MSKIYILWLRQIKKYVRSHARLLGSLFEPIVFLLVLGFGLSSVFKQAGQGDYFTLLVPGIMCQSIIFNAMFSGTEIIWDRQFGFLKETFVAPISRFDVMLGRTLGSATVATIQGTLVMLVAIALGFRPLQIATIIPAVGIMALVALLYTSLGTLLASMFKNIQSFQAIMNFLVLPMFLLSGALFPLASVSGLLSIFIRLDPLAYGVDALRALFMHTGYYGIGLDISLLAGMTVIFLWLGGYFFKKVQV